MIMCCILQKTKKDRFMRFLQKRRNPCEVKFSFILEPSGKNEDLHTLLRDFLSREASRRNPVPTQANVNLDPDLEHASILKQIIDSDRYIRWWLYIGNFHTLLLYWRRLKFADTSGLCSHIVMVFVASLLIYIKRQLKVIWHFSAKIVAINL